MAEKRGGLWSESPLWSHSPLHANDDGQVTQGEFMNALSDQVPLLGAARDWRATLRGRDRFGAPKAARELHLGAPRGTVQREPVELRTASEIWLVDDRTVEGQHVEDTNVSGSRRCETRHGRPGRRRRWRASRRTSVLLPTARKRP